MQLDRANVTTTFPYLSIVFRCSVLFNQFLDSVSILMEMSTKYENIIQKPITYRSGKVVE